MRKQHNFKVGDKLVRDDGLTCTVERIDPMCNNIYGKDFSSYRPNGSELSSPDMWAIDKSATGAVSHAREFIPDAETFEVTILKIREGVGPSPLTVAGFSCTFVQRETISRSLGTGNYRKQVKTYLEETAANLTVPGEYVAFAIYGDNDTITRQFSVKPLPVQSPVEVTFA